MMLRLLIFLAYLIPVTGLASDYRSTTVIEQYITVNEAEVPCDAVAVAQIHFDYATHSLQGGIGFSKRGNCHGAALGVGKRSGDFLYNLTVSNSIGQTTVGAGTSWRF